MQTKTDVKLHAFDPWDPWAGVNLRMEAAERRALDPASRPPAHWGELRPEQRALLAGLAAHVLALHGPLSGVGGHLARLPYVRERLVEALAATYLLSEKGGFGHPLAELFERDPEKREVWRKLGMALQSPPIAGGSLLVELLVGLVSAGDLEQSIVARIDAQLAQLERLRGSKGLAAKIHAQLVEGSVRPKAEALTGSLAEQLASGRGL